MKSSFELPQQLPTLLLPWFAENARDLPWRADQEPYHVWISEIMLQQTRVEAVKSYYLRFLEAFPTLEALAEAPEERLLKLWEGLGYYNRARNLQKAACQILALHKGQFPNQASVLQTLPGIGAYTAGAIASICFDEPSPAVDGNVLRVAARLTTLKACVDQPQTKTAVTEALRSIYPKKACGDFTQALMELGACVCVPNGEPHCKNCPLRSICHTADTDAWLSIPVRQKKHPRKKELKTVFLLRYGNQIALEKRPNTGLLAGLWQMPNVEGTLTEQEAIHQASSWGLKPSSLLRTLHRIHIFTHVEWHMTAYEILCGSDSEQFIWSDSNSISHALPTAFRIFLESD